LDAEILLATARDCERIQLYTSFEEVVGEEVRATFRDFVRRRAAGEPVAYLVGQREFFSLTFNVTRDVLIPRPETEHLVVEALDLIKAAPQADAPLQVADVGTGSGAIAISIAKHAPQSHVTAVDVSPEAIEVARGNAERHGVTDQMDLVVGDLLEPVPAEPRFGLIASNPPYISQGEWERLPSEIKDYEPTVALLGGTSGTEVVARLVPQAAERLQPGGWLVMEISPMVEQATRELLAHDGRFESAETTKDLAGLHRIIKSQRRTG
jgi:release factor glutamine methyltransferase